LLLLTASFARCEDALTTTLKKPDANGTTAEKIVSGPAAVAGQCLVHHEALVAETVPVVHEEPALSASYRKAQARLFPNATHPYVARSGDKSAKEMVIGVCKRCDAAKALWLEQHPAESKRAR
jgi:hypothetical protein